MKTPKRNNRYYKVRKKTAIYRVVQDKEAMTAGMMIRVGGKKVANVGKLRRVERRGLKDAGKVNSVKVVEINKAKPTISTVTSKKVNTTNAKKKELTNGTGPKIK